MSRDPTHSRAPVAVDALAAARDLRGAMTDFLRRLVEVETPSPEPESQRPALDLIQGELESIGLSCRRHPGRTSGGTILARWPAPPGTPFQLLIGHTDTVWPRGTLRTMPVRLDGSRMHGPGVYDMKAGLTQTLYALRILRRLGAEPSVRPVVLVNSDEEIGTRDSHATIRRLARRADRALIMEPSLTPAGKLKTTRKGVRQYALRVVGRAAHAGLDPEGGVSAILEICGLVRQISELNDPARGITVNVGTLTGGSRPNVIAAEARAEIDVRVPTRDDADRVDAAVRSLEPVHPEAVVDIEMTEGRAPMEPSEGGRRLWEAARRIADELGMPLDHGQAGGGSDGNITAQHTPTLDGLGAVGDGAHALHEHVDLDHMAGRTALLAALIMEPPTGSPPSDDHQPTR